MTKGSDQHSGVLTGYRVLEVGQFGAAPLCAMLLGDMGADVVKVEQPGRGDPYRYNLPVRDGWSYYFAALNRSKRSVTIDIKRPEGQELLLRLAERFDILIENMRPGSLDRLGLGHEDVLRRNPRLVYCSVSGFGHTGPLRDEGAYDQIIQGYSGMMALTGHPGQPPAKLAPGVPDVLGTYGAGTAILGALLHREKTGEGQWIDLSLLDASLFSMTLIYLPQLIGYGESPQPMGAAHPAIVPLDAYPTADGSYVNTGIVTPAMWEPFCNAVGHPELAQEARFATISSRLEHRRELDDLLRPVFRSRTRAEWVDIMTAHGVPAGPVLDLKEAFDHPQSRAREMLIRTPDPVWGEVDSVGHPFKFSRNPNSVRLPVPRLGEHTVDVLQSDLGLSENEIRRLRDAEVIA